MIEQAKRSLGAMLTLQVYFQSTITQLYLPAFLLDQLMINTLLNAQQQGATMVWLTLHPCFIDDQPYIGLQITDDGVGLMRGNWHILNKIKPNHSHAPLTRQNRMVWAWDCLSVSDCASLLVAL